MVAEDAHGLGAEADRQQLDQLGHVVGEVLDRAAVHEGEERGQQRQQGFAASVGRGGHLDRAD